MILRWNYSYAIALPRTLSEGDAEDQIGHVVPDDGHGRFERVELISPLKRPRRCAHATCSAALRSSSDQSIQPAPALDSLDREPAVLVDAVRLTPGRARRCAAGHRQLDR